MFLNHAAFGPIPQSARDAIRDLWSRHARLEPGDDVDDETFRLLPESKRAFGELIGQSDKRVAFGPNTSYGLNMVLWGLSPKSGERILIPEVEFPAVVYSVRSIADRCGITVESLPCPDGFLTVGTLERALSKKAAVLAMSWVQYFNGYRYDLKEIANLCHKQGCFLLVDAIQGVGVVPMEMRSWGVDALACGAQKWLLGPSGAGFFAIAEDPIRPVEPPFGGWLGRDWGYRFGDLQHWDRPSYPDGRSWEVGSYPHHAVRQACAGLNLLVENGAEATFQHVDRLTGRLADGLVGSPYRANRFPEKANRAGVVTVGGPRIQALHEHLVERGFHLAVREGNIRVSPHFYNTESEIDSLIGEIGAFR